MPPHPFAIAPPIAPMLAKLATELPVGDAFLYEPKWDGFRAIVFCGTTDVFIQSRDPRPLDRYFPELHAAFPAALPEGSVVDGEICEGLTWRRDEYIGIMRASLRCPRETGCAQLQTSTTSAATSLKCAGKPESGNDHGL